MASKSLVKKLDRVFSEFIRKRDSKDGYFICCSCGQRKTYEQADCGHFINRRWMAVRFDERNCHAQCRSCNRFDEGNIVGYTRFMIRTYGEDVIDLLESLKVPYKWTDGELDILIKDYKNKLKELING